MLAGVFCLSNLTDGWKFELAQVKRELLLERGRERKAEAANATNASRWDNGSLLSTIDKSDKDASHNTQAAIAKDLGWSTGKTAYGRGGFFVMQR